MPGPHELLETLCCPVDRRPLRPMTADELRSLNDAIAAGRAGDAGGARVTEALESGLTTDGEAAFYPVSDGVPVLLPARRITVRDGGPPETTATAPALAGSAEAVWEWLASVWHLRRPPARPAPEDIALVERRVEDALAGRPAPRALLLGVTPEIATMRWPAGTRLLAVDASEAMIRKVWPAESAPHATAVRGDWAVMPVRDGVFDLVVGDASLSFQPYPEPFGGAVREVRRVLRRDGALVTRVYTRPETREPLDAIFADLRAGRIGGLEHLWWRLYTALHGDRAHGSTSNDLWEAWATHVPDPAGLVEALGWPPATVRVMEGLRGVTHPMVFPTLREFRDDVASGFEEVACEAPAIEGGDRNPTLVLRPRPR